MTDFDTTKKMAEKQLSKPKRVHLNFQYLCMFTIDKINIFFFFFLQNSVFKHMFKLLNAFNIQFFFFCQIVHREFRTSNFTASALKNFFYH